MKFSGISIFDQDRFQRLFGFAAIAVMASLLTAQGEIVNLLPLADAEIRAASSPDGNYGSAPTMVSGRLRIEEVRRALLRFDLSGIPPGATITSAVLKVQVTMTPLGGGANSTFDLRKVLRGWTEATVTWNNRTAESSPWEIPGVTGDLDRSGTASGSVAVAGIGAYSFTSTVGLIGDVQNWVTNAASNFGWLLTSKEETTSQTARHFGARENPTAANRPVLTVGYSVASRAISPVLTNVMFSADEFQFTFVAEANRPYAVETRAAFAADDWFVTTNFPAETVTRSQTFRHRTTNSAQFFRVVTP